jgi:hypothetical protein
VPSPTPTDEDVNDVREVTGEISRTTISALIDNLNDAEWGRALDLVAAWRNTEPGDLLTLEGGRDGVGLSDQEGLDDIRRRMRLLLGLPEFRDSSITGQPGTTSVPVLWVW